MNNCNKPPVNMRRALKSPTLRLEDGGSVGFASSTPEMQAQASAAQATNMAGFARQSAAFNPTPTAPAATQKYAKADYSLPDNTFSPMAVPQLRDGGEVSPWSLRGIIQNVQSAVTPTPPTPEQAQRARELADYKARAEAERNAPKPVAPVTPAPAQAAAPVTAITDYSSGNATTMRMKAAGLRDGGDLRTGHGGNVPGTGEGDKIPAKYEPGEFVVSNAMLDAAPGLREELHDLRGNVLAKQGKSVAQADAEAVTPTGLRANKGVDFLKQAFPNGAQDLDLGSVGKQPSPQAMGGAAQRVVPPVADPAAPKYTPPPVDPTTGRYAHETQTGQRPVVEGRPSGVGSSGGTASSVHTAPDVASPKPTSLWGKTKAAGGAVGSGVKSVTSGSFLNADVGAIAKNAARGGANVVRSAAASPFTPASLAGAGIATAVQGMETPTEHYRLRAGADARGDVAGDLAARGVGVLADLGDAVTFGGATRFGNYIAGNGFKPNNPDGSAPGAAPDQPNGQAPRPVNHMGQNFDDPRLVNADPSRASLGASVDNTLRLGAVPKDLPSDLREGVIHKTVGPNGTTVYSGRNVSGDAQFVDGKGATTGSRGGVTSLPGMSQAQIDSTLTNPNGSRWSTADNATMAANLRDGVDPYRGTSRQPQGQGQDDPLAALRAKAMDSNAIGHNGAARMLIAAEQNQALREGHRMNYDAAMAGHNMTRNGNLARLQYDMNKDQRDFQTGRSDKMHEQDRQAEDDFQKHAAEATTGRGPDGKPMQDPTAAADYMRTVRHTVAQTIQDPNTPPEVREKLRSKGLAGLDVADRAALANWYKTRKIQTEDHGGINPFKSKGDVSDDLRDYKPNGEDNTLLQKRVRNNMGSVPVTSLQYGPTANHVMWNSGPADQTLVPKKLRD